MSNSTVNFNQYKMKGIIKSQILKALHSRYGDGTFRYTDIIKEVLVQRGIIRDHAEYDWREHRGYYAGAITKYGGDYFYRHTKKNPWELVSIPVGYNKNVYKVRDCRYLYED